jgi:hypothetical protein
MRVLLNNAFNFSQLAQSVRQFFSGISLLDLACNLKWADKQGNH